LYPFLLDVKKKFEILPKSKVIAKYVVFEDSISSKLIDNLNAVKEFDNKRERDKSPFKLDGKFYKFEREFKLDSKGHLTILTEHNYYSFDYADYGIKKTLIDRKTIGQTLLVKFSPSYKEVIDCKDTFEIEDIIPEKKLIFVKQKRKDSRLFIYEYK